MLRPASIFFQSQVRDNSEYSKVSPFILCNVTILSGFDIVKVLERVFRNSRLQMFFKIGALKNFANFIEKNLTSMLATSLKRDFITGVFL